MPKKLTLEEAFWPHVQIPEGSGDNCWLWTYRVHVKGYGSIKRGKHFIGAHRVSWMLHHGDIPPGMFVCHKCDVRLCVRPDHLFLGTCAENLGDMAAKGRSTRKLTDEAVVAIRQRWSAGETQMALAREYGVSQNTVSRIACHKYPLTSEYSRVSDSGS